MSPLRYGIFLSLTLLVVSASVLLAGPGRATAGGYAAPLHTTNELLAALQAPGPSDGASAPDGTLETGTQAVVRADGDCLRLRATPGLAGERLTCLPEGTIVLVLAGSVELDGIEWQFVQANGASGWAASEFLQPAAEAPSCVASGAATPRPGLAGSLASSGGIGLAVWGGGTAQGVATVAATSGCNLRSIWASKPGGGFVGFLYGAPDFVNAEWFAQLPGGQIPAGTPLITICNGPNETSQIALSSTIAAPALPTPVGIAPTNSAGPAAPSISAAAAVVVDHASGAVLWEFNGHERRAPASLTKIATAILAIEGSDLDGWAAVDVDSRQMPGSSLMGLRPGDCFQVRDLAYGLMLPSGNDAALAIGRHIAGSDAAFVAQMNTLAARLGLQDTTFTDPHGLGGPDHRTSAHDIAMMARYGMTLPQFTEIVSASSWTAIGSRTIRLQNVNRFLSSYTDADGVKTGFTEEAGRTLAASATRNGHRVYVVVLDAPDRFDDASDLLDWVFAQFQWP